MIPSSGCNLRQGTRPPALYPGLKNWLRHKKYIYVLNIHLYAFIDSFVITVAGGYTSVGSIDCGSKIFRSGMVLRACHFSTGLLRKFMDSLSYIVRSVSENSKTVLV